MNDNRVLKLDGDLADYEYMNAVQSASILAQKWPGDWRR